MTADAINYDLLREVYNDCWNKMRNLKAKKDYALDLLNRGIVGLAWYEVELEALCAEGDRWYRLQQAVDRVLASNHPINALRQSPNAGPSDDDLALITAYLADEEA